MLAAPIVTLCCCAVLFCPALGYSQHLCDIESWVADNDMPINKLDLSTQSKTKLVQGLRSAGKLIKCSELRLIHKEAELDRPFRQNRYKVSSKRAKDSLARRDDDRRSDSEHERFLYERDDRGYNREETGEEHDRNSARSDDFADSAASSHNTGSSQDQTHQQTANQKRGTGSEKQSKEEIGLPDKAASHQEQQQQSVSGTPVPETSPLNRTAESPAVDIEKHDVVLDTRLQQSFNETRNSSVFQPTNGTAANVTSGNRTMNSLVDWLHLCYSCPLALNLTRSWKLCRLLPARDSKVNETQPEPEVHASPPLPALCQRCALECRNISIYLCEVLFPIMWPKIETTSRPLDNSSIASNATEAAPATKDNTIRPLTVTNVFILTCFQCPVASPDHNKLWISNTTQSICVFATENYHQKGDWQTHQESKNQQQQNLLTDKLQFIDEETAASVVADSPANGRELMGDTEQSTRARHEIHRQQEQGQQQQEQPKDGATNSTQQQHSNQSSDEAGVPQPESAAAAATNDIAAETLAKQVDSLSHSVFMEKLFEALSRKQKMNASLSMVNTSASELIDSLSSKVDHLVNMTAQKTNRSELSQLEIRLQKTEARLVKKLVLMERKNRRLVDQIRQLEALKLTAMKLTDCQRRLNQTNSSLQSLARRHSAQLAMVTRRLAQMSQRVESTEHKWNRTQLLLQPAMPLLSPDKSGESLRVRDRSEPPQHESPPLHTVASAALPNVNGKSVIDDCSDIYARAPNKATIDDGIFLANLGLSAPVKVRCDLKNSGWTYILSRSDGKVDFFRNWTSYRAGFGNPPGEHFIGLDALAEMTSRRRYQLQVVLEDWEGSVKHVQYSQFHVLGERHNFQLRVNHFDGDPTVGDALSSHSNASFSTFDADNDLVQSKFGGNCAKRFRGGFWYFSCYRANPTGRYYSNGGRIPDKKCDGIVWKPWKGPHYSLRSIHMKVRPIPL